MSNALTPTQKEVYDYCSQKDFMPDDVFQDFKAKLEAESNLPTLSYATEDFIEELCPQCGVRGLFKFHFLGKLKHPQCSLSWYVTPGTYIAKQLGSVFKAGMGTATETSMEAEKKGEKQGFLTSVFMFLFGAIFRLVVAIILIPIQLIFSLGRGKAAATKQ